MTMFEPNGKILSEKGKKEMKIIFAQLECTTRSLYSLKTKQKYQLFTISRLSNVKLTFMPLHANHYGDVRTLYRNKCQR